MIMITIMNWLAGINLRRIIWHLVERYKVSLISYRSHMFLRKELISDLTIQKERNFMAIMKSSYSKAL